MLTRCSPRHPNLADVLWGPSHSQLSDAFFRPVKQDLTSNLQ